MNMSFLWGKKPQVLASELDQLRKDVSDVARAARENASIRVGREPLALTTDVLRFLSTAGGPVDEPEIQAMYANLREFCSHLLSLRLMAGSQLICSTKVYDLKIFSSLESLQILRVEVECLRGIEALRPRLRFLTARKAVKNLKVLFSLCAADRAVSELPWSHLESLDLHDNSLMAIDDSFKLFPALELLDLSANDLSAITADFKYLRSLTSLNLADNRVKTLRPLLESDVLGALKRLTILNVSSNGLTSLIGIEGLLALEELDVSHNQIDTIDEMRRVCHFAKLRRLAVAGNPFTAEPHSRPRVFSFFPAWMDLLLDGARADSLEQIVTEQYILHVRGLLPPSTTPLFPTSDSPVPPSPSPSAARAASAPPPRLAVTGSSEQLVIPARPESSASTRRVTKTSTSSGGALTLASAAIVTNVVVSAKKKKNTRRPAISGPPQDTSRAPSASGMDESFDSVASAQSRASRRSVQDVENFFGEQAKLHERTHRILQDSGSLTVLGEYMAAARKKSPPRNCESSDVVDGSDLLAPLIPHDMLKTAPFLSTPKKPDNGRRPSRKPRSVLSPALEDDHEGDDTAPSGPPSDSDGRSASTATPPPIDASAQSVARSLTFGDQRTGGGAMDGLAPLSDTQTAIMVESTNGGSHESPASSDAARSRSTSVRDATASPAPAVAVLELSSSHTVAVVAGSTSPPRSSVSAVQPATPETAPTILQPHTPAAAVRSPARDFVPSAKSIAQVQKTSEFIVTINDLSEGTFILQVIGEASICVFHPRTGEDEDMYLLKDLAVVSTRAAPDVRLVFDDFDQSRRSLIFTMDEEQEIAALKVLLSPIAQRNFDAAQTRFGPRSLCKECAHRFKSDDVILCPECATSRPPPASPSTSSLRKLVSSGVVVVANNLTARFSSATSSTSSPVAPPPKPKDPSVPPPAKPFSSQTSNDAIIAFMQVAILEDGERFIARIPTDCFVIRSESPRVAAMAKWTGVLVLSSREMRMVLVKLGATEDKTQYVCVAHWPYSSVTLVEVSLGLLGMRVCLREAIYQFSVDSPIKLVDALRVMAENTDIRDCPVEISYDDSATAFTKAVPGLISSPTRPFYDSLKSFCSQLPTKSNGTLPYTTPWEARLGVWLNVPVHIVGVPDRDFTEWRLVVTDSRICLLAERVLMATALEEPMLWELLALRDISDVASMSYTSDSGVFTINFFEEDQALTLPGGGSTRVYLRKRWQCTLDLETLWMVHALLNRVWTTTFRTPLTWT
eukprot:m.242145 g.242145  ORF g.242145 m.242145 type:complete len:1249 (+) comp13975_c0_seq1:105-3851(+)